MSEHQDFKRRHQMAALICVMAACGVCPAQAGSYQWKALVSPDGYDFAPNSISDSGAITGLYADGGGVVHYGVLSKGKFIEAPVCAGASGVTAKRISYPWGVNTTGKATLGCQYSNGKYSFTYNINRKTLGAQQSFKVFKGWTVNQAPFAIGVSDGGLVIANAVMTPPGGTSADAISVPVKAGLGGVRPIKIPLATSAYATSMSPSGTITGFYVDAGTGVEHGFIDGAGGVSVIDYPGALGSELDASRDTTSGGGPALWVAGNHSGGPGLVGPFAFSALIAGGTVVKWNTFIDPSLTRLTILSIDTAGVTYGLRSDPVNGDQIFVGVPGVTPFAVSYPGAQFTRPIAANGQGMIVGTFQDADGNIAHFQATCPSGEAPCTQ